MKKVMLVEDEELILQGIRNIIDWEALGLEVVHMAHNGKEALSLWEKEPVDLVVTDVEMPVMNGLNLLREIRGRDERVRFVILTGYDEFEYARKAIPLDVEDYILKPIDEEQLEAVAKKALLKLREMDRDNAKDMEDRIGWQKFLEGGSSEEEQKTFLSLFPRVKKAELLSAAVMKIDSRSMRKGDMSELLSILQEEACRVIHLGTDTLLLIDSFQTDYTWNGGEGETAGKIRGEIHSRFSCLQNRLESELGIFTFISKDTDVNNLYQTALKIAMLLWDIKGEYKLEEKNMQDLSDMVEGIYGAEDIFGLKAMFISEISEIITYLHTENSAYTPVVKQIMAEVQKNYREELSLKTLAYKYHMNASYLGQIFQKEVGCSFTQYLSNIKNGIAKDLILNTNRRINDIAQEVGYTDTSYFYRKFKQCYGVSPASLREMKKY